MVFDVRNQKLSKEYLEMGQEQAIFSMEKKAFLNISIGPKTSWRARSKSDTYENADNDDGNKRSEKKMEKMKRKEKQRKERKKLKQPSIVYTDAQLSGLLKDAIDKVKTYKRLCVD